MPHPSEPVSPAKYGEGPPDDAALEAAGYAAGLDVWDQVSKAYENYLGDGALANAQLWSLRQAIRRQAITRTPEQAAREQAEKTETWPEGWGPFHRHFANDAVHRDGGPECDQPGTPRRVYVFDPDTLDEHERFVARRAVEHPDRFLDSGGV